MLGGVAATYRKWEKHGLVYGGLNRFTVASSGGWWIIIIVTYASPSPPWGSERGDVESVSKKDATDV
jgi:hypothetical protein